MTVGERIKAVRGNMSAPEFCKRINIHKNTLYGYELGKSVPNFDFLEEVCRHYNVNPEWLLMGTGSMYKTKEETSENRPENQNLVHNRQAIYSDENGQIAIPQWQNPDPEMFDYIPMAETQLSAGGGAFVISEEIEGYYAFRKNWLSRVASSTKNLVLMRVMGDSMSPTIQEDDTVLIDIGKKSIKEGMIYAIRFDSTVMIKRLTFRPGGRILIISDNRHEYESYEADMRDLHIIGQIIFFCRTFATD